MKKQKVGFKNYLKRYKILLFLPFFDVLTTFLFTSKLGYDAESNFIGRYLMNTFGNFGFVFMWIFATLCLIFVLWVGYVFVSKVGFKYFNKEKLNFKNYVFEHCAFTSGAIMGTYFFVLIVNIRGFLLT